MTRVPTRTLVALWLCATLAAMFIAGVATQTTDAAPRCNQITGLVLDGGQVTTTAPVSSARRPVEPIPYRQIGDPTTTEKRCG